jgi:hypothetical protein
MGMGFYRLETIRRKVPRRRIHQARTLPLGVNARDMSPRHAESIAAGRYSIEPQARALLEGVCTRFFGAPLAGGRSSVSPRHRASTRARARTPALGASVGAGRYSFARLAVGSYTVAFSKSGYIAETAVIQR